MKWTHGLPTVPVMGLAIQPRELDLVVGTHGRSVYVIAGAEIFTQSGYKLGFSVTVIRTTPWLANSSSERP